ncbi:MAG: undecaprenyldiphospho-muramoylpentapeptide beta-N-acetylglucosaminyltransferase [Gammaproteobacteria bacterium]|nr:undecaprenyldiphospho-muramoylpentapeptide beta-N-acetylglucosaminyltransferase [Gammaproteobacteria bacterium]
MNKTAVIMAGGTGGHIFPGLALAHELQQAGWQVHWMGTVDRMEADIVPKYDIPLHFIDVKGVRGNGLKRLLSMPYMLLNAVLQARNIFKTLKPNLVIGFGGYASGPGGIAAKSLGIPLVIHEQNAVLGMTNKYLSKVANQTLLAFPLANGSKKQFEVVGNPVRHDIVKLHQQAKRHLNQQSKFELLVVGGSLGAKALNDALPEIFTELGKNHALNIVHQAGKGKANPVESAYQSLVTKKAPNDFSYRVNEFIDDMPAQLASADLVICRAGALTVSELAASGNVGVFVPLPHAVDDHQTANANWLVNSDAGLLVPQLELDKKMLNVLTQLLTEPSRINTMQQNAAEKAVVNTTARMLSLCEQYGKK